MSGWARREQVEEIFEREGPGTATVLAVELHHEGEVRHVHADPGVRWPTEKKVREAVAGQRSLFDYGEYDDEDGEPLRAGRDTGTRILVVEHRRGHHCTDRWSDPGCRVLRTHEL